MPGRRVSMRPTVFHRIVNAPEKRENLSEYLVLGTGILTNFIFVVGCVLFFEAFSIEVNNIGLWLFLIASLMNVFLSVYVMWEHKEAQEAFEGGARDEFLEHVLYVGSGLFFAVGSVLWMPVWGDSQARKFVGHSASAWCFVWGSLGLVLASVWNAFGLVEENAKKGEVPTKTDILCRRLASVALCCTAVGGALFVAGSFMFRPAFENDCKEAVERSVDRHWKHRQHHTGFLQVDSGSWDPPRLSHGAEGLGAAPAWCLSIINQGTWVYLWGCVLFLAQSLISLAVCLIMNRADARPKMGVMVNRRAMQARMLSKASQTVEASAQQQRAPAPDARPQLVLQEREKAVPVAPYKADADAAAPPHHHAPAA